MQYRCGYCKLEYPWGYHEGTLEATVTEATAHPVAAEYPHSTLNDTPTCSSLSGTVLDETHVPVKRNLDVYVFATSLCRDASQKF